MSEIRRNTIGVILCLIALSMLFVSGEINSLVENVIYAALFTTSLYLIYDSKREHFKRQIELIESGLKIKVIHEPTTNRFSYFCFGDEVTKEELLELIHMVFEPSKRKTSLFMDYLENESKMNLEQ